MRVIRVRRRGGDIFATLRCAAVAFLQSSVTASEGSGSRTEIATLYARFAIDLCALALRS